MRWQPEAPGVVLSPHPDDAVLSAWSVLRSPGPIEVITVCAGIPPTGTLGSFDPLFGISDSAALMTQRLAEDIQALELADRQPRHLPFFDDQYRSEPLDPSVLVETLVEHMPQVSHIWAPVGIGNHPDHVAVRQAAALLASQTGAPLTLYAEWPYAILSGWPHWVTGAPPRPYLVPEARWADDLARAEADVGVPLTPHPVALGRDESAQKLRSLQCYTSQFAALNAGPLERLSNPEILGFELYWDVGGGSGT